MIDLTSELLSFSGLTQLFFWSVNCCTC